MHNRLRAYVSHRLQFRALKHVRTNLACRRIVSIFYPTSETRNVPGVRMLWSVLNVSKPIHCLTFFSQQRSASDILREHTQVYP